MVNVKFIWLIAFMFISSLSGQANKDYLLSLNEMKIGGYISLGGRYSTIINSSNAEFLDYKAGLTFNGEWAIGLHLSGLIHNDKELTSVVNDGTYSLYVTYGTIFIEKIYSLNNDFKLSIYLSTGYGEAYYRYDKDYRKNKLWSEETIDRTEFYVLEPGIEIQHRIAGNWWIGLNIAYRNTSPIELVNTDENFLKKLSGGINFKWGIF